MVHDRRGSLTSKLSRRARPSGVSCHRGARLIWHVSALESIHGLILAVAIAISTENLDVLRDSAFDIPKSRQLGDFGAFLAVQHRCFFEAVGRFGGQLADRLAERAYWMLELASTLEAVVDCTRQRRHDRAWQLIEDILDEHSGTLQIMSLRHAYRVIGSRSWYRLTTWAEAKTRRDVFHLPFDKKAASYRFSPPGRPALYLGNNVYVCWLECQCKLGLLASYRVARFEIDMRDNEYFLDLPTNHSSYLEPLSIAASMAGVAQIDPGRITNSPYLDDLEGNLVEYLSLWPLLMASTVQKLQPAPDEPPEYVIPQFLMRWVLKRKDLLGIRYFTSKFDRATNSNDVSINVVLPARTTNKPDGFCDFLIDRVRCTPPQSFDDAASAPDETLFREEAADIRETAAGRCMVEWAGSLRHYQETPFGRMEYWLDRPELAVARIDCASSI